MENLNLLINQNAFVIICVLLLFIVILFAYLAALKNSLNKLQKKYEFFTASSGDVNIDAVLTRNMENLSKLEEEVLHLRNKHDNLREQVKSCIQNVKIERYDAFDAMGGEMSYSILLADEKNNGVILTSIYGREESRCYAKDVKNGKSSYVLAEEEKKLL